VPGASLLPCAWPTEAFMDRLSGRVEGSVFDLYPAMAPAILNFIRAHEAARMRSAH
jgi:hypothetical protein